MGSTDISRIDALLKPQTRCLPFLGLCFWFLLSFLGDLRAEETWIKRDGASFTAQLDRFDFQQKTARFNGFDGRVFEAVAADLNFRSKCRLFISKAFHASFPEDWGATQTRFVVVVIGLPAVFSLAGFWLSGLLIAGRWNPVRAIFGWIGTVLLAAFLAMFYLYIASLSKANSGPLFAFGGTISLVALALFVSVIFKTSTFKGAVIFLFHFVAAAALFFAAAVVVERGVDPVRKNQLADDYVFRPVGLIR